MKKSYKKILTLEIIMILGLLMDILFLKQFQLSSVFNILIWLIVIIGIKVLLELEKDKSLNKVDTIQITFIYTFVYLLIIYSLGLVTGFTRNAYNLSFLSIMQNTIPAIVIIVIQEIFRFNIITKAKKNNLCIFLMVTILVLFDVIFNFNGYDYSTQLGYFALISTLILPSIVNNVFLTFISEKSGYMPPIIYRIISECYIYLIPIIPDLNEYINSMCLIIFPTILFLKFNTIYAKNSFNIVRRKLLTSRAKNMFLGTFATIIVVLVSGVFNYYAMSIGSQSMEPRIRKGDVVVIDQSNKVPKKGNVVAYKHEDRIIVHRIKKITKTSRKVIITTKGDNNMTEDQWQVSPSDIVGTVKLKIPLIGWPSVWLSVLF